MKLPELYYTGKGYQPLVMTEYWQLAQLNYDPGQSPEALQYMDQHDFTDETFTLMEGRAFLITLDDKGKAFFTSLKRGVTYNVPAMMWHNIAMDEGACVMIAEGRDAHLKGFAQIPLSVNVKQEILAYTKSQWS